MITSKQRATLRSQSNGLETIFQIGKGGISDMLVQQVNDALKAREMIKLRVLENAPVLIPYTMGICLCAPRFATLWGFPKFC